MKFSRNTAACIQGTWASNDASLRVPATLPKPHCVMTCSFPSYKIRRLFLFYYFRWDRIIRIWTHYARSRVEVEIKDSYNTWTQQKCPFFTRNRKLYLAWCIFTEQVGLELPLWACIREGLGSSPRRDTGYPGWVFLCSSLVPLGNSTSTRPRPFIIHQPSYHQTLCSLDTGSHLKEYAFSMHAFAR